MLNPPASADNNADAAQRLLAWYDAGGRVLPWRVPPGEDADPYRVWLSEIMLQQTTVATVGPRYGAFLTRWPDVAALAAAPLDDVLHEWQGLGYYARARNLHACARVVADDLDGRFPETETELRKLPGVGAYTAAAIAAIAFGRAAAAVDGNVVRVMARLGALRASGERLRSAVEARLRPMVPAARPGDFAQALMDLGATVCAPRTPVCGACPWAADCRGLALGGPQRFPVKAAKRPKPTRRGLVYWMLREDGAVGLERRPAKGLLGGMTGFPSSPWAEAAIPATPAGFGLLPGLVRHTFTHFHLELAVAVGAAVGPGDETIWARPGAFKDHALPTVMKKVARHVAESGQSS